MVEYILQDNFDRRLFFKGIHEPGDYPIYTEHVENAIVLDKEAADMYAVKYNLQIRKMMV